MLWLVPLWQVWSALESGSWQPRDASIALTTALKRTLGPQTAGQPHVSAAKDEAWRLFAALQRAGLVSCTTAHHGQFAGRSELCPCDLLEDRSS